MKRIVLALVILLAACGRPSAPQAQTSPGQSPTAIVTGSPSASPTPSPPSESTPASYSMNRITFRYSISWRLQPPPPGGSIIWLYSPDYKDNGGMEIQTIQQGARIDFGQTDIPQKDVTAHNYGSNSILYPSNATNGTVIVVSGRNAFQYRQANPPWFDSTDTVFFRDDGTRVEVRISFPNEQPATHALDYQQILESLVY